MLKIPAVQLFGNADRVLSNAEAADNGEYRLDSDHTGKVPSELASVPSMSIMPPQRTAFESLARIIPPESQSPQAGFPHPEGKGPSTESETPIAQNGACLHLWVPDEEDLLWYCARCGHRHA